MGNEVKTPGRASPFPARFILDREEDDWTLYVEIEPMFEFAKSHMDPDAFLRFELGVRRAADEMRDRGATPRKRWWKPRV
jgi:hypothetical protein